MNEHEKYTIVTTFVVCDGMKDKALEEMKDLLQHIKVKSLNHASDLKVTVSHATMEDK